MTVDSSMRSVAILSSRIAQKSTSFKNTERYVRYNRKKIVDKVLNGVKNEIVSWFTHCQICATSFFAEHKRRNLVACPSFSLHESGLQYKKLQYKKNHKSN